MGPARSEDERSIATPMPEVVARLAALLLFTIFAWAAAMKLVSYDRWSAILDRYGLPSMLRTAARPGVPIAEGAIAIAGVFLSPRIGAAAALAVLAGFSLAVLRARTINGDKLPCGCFGGSEERHYRTMIFRNGLLAASAAAVLLADEYVDPVAASLPATGDALPFVLALAGLGLALWTASQVSNAMKRSR